ncbi:hypothetical protein [uncultured Psychroserpens sp.]|uniref:hypothetical protein n=1 Tax=uncultured Psychroserpens sp. TaxID=255436 RepID=UPI00262C52FA|nr:hypothetical protein [uncultured Psychroserpens sp.]
MLNKKNLIFVIIGAMIFLIFACNSDQKTSQNEVTTETASEPNSNIEQIWPNNNESKEFKIDSSDFKIYASKENLGIRLEKSSSYNSQLNKIKMTLTTISEEIDLRELKKVMIQPLNYELLSNIASVSEIQSEMIQRDGKVNSMKTVSPNAYKSEYLTEITNIFQQFELEPFDYYIDKCRGEEIQGDSASYTLRCASIGFKLRKIE